MQKAQKKSFIWIGLCAILIAASVLVPAPAGLGREGLSAIAILLSAIVLWISEALPLAVTTLLCCVLLPFFNVMPLNDMFMRFGNSTFFFMIATFCLTAAIVDSTIPKRVSLALMKWAGRSGMKLILGFGFGTALFSAFMSNVPACAVFCALVMALVKESDEFKQNKGLVKCLLIAVTYGAVIGGFCTPAGTSSNILGINLYAELTGVEVTFLQWCLVGTPAVIIFMIITCILLYVLFRPTPIGEDTLKAMDALRADCGPMSTREIKMLGITVLTFVLWIVGSWVPVLNATAVSLLTMALFFFPGINVLTWDKFASEAPWDSIFLIGGSSALAQGLIATGADMWLIETVLPDVSSWSPFLILLLCGLLAAILHILIPTGPGVVAIAIPTFTVMTRAISGINPYAVMMIATLWSCVVFVMPVDAVTLVSYKTGEYNLKELLKAGIPAYLVLLPVSAFVINVLCNLVF